MAAAGRSENTEAPSFIRTMCDCTMPISCAGPKLRCPKRKGWDAFIHAYRGRIDVNETSLDTKRAHCWSRDRVRVRALDDAIVVAFLINSKAR